jgi:hypothetical protein
MCGMRLTRDVMGPLLLPRERLPRLARAVEQASWELIGRESMAPAAVGAFGNEMSFRQRPYDPPTIRGQVSTNLRRSSLGSTNPRPSCV